MKKEFISYTISFLFHLLIFFFLKRISFQKQNYGHSLDETFYNISILPNCNQTAIEEENNKVSENKEQSQDPPTNNINLEKVEIESKEILKTNEIENTFKTAISKDKNQENIKQTDEKYRPITTVPAQVTSEKNQKKSEKDVANTTIKEQNLNSDSIYENKKEDSTGISEKNIDIDQRSIYSGKIQGNPNSDPNHSGAILEMKGWEWEDTPNANDDTDEVGKLVFEIKVDSLGEIISIKTIERSVSIKVEQLYKEALLETTFSRKNEYDEFIPSVSIGRVTFFLKYK